MKTVFSILIQLINATLFSQYVQISQPVRFLALGDSYTVGTSVETVQSWPYQLYDRLFDEGYKREKIQILAHAGWRTDDLAAALRKENPSSDFNLASLLIGVNDQYQGISIDTNEIPFSSSGSIVFDLPSLTEGVYLIEVKTASRTIVSKIIITNKNLAP
jgi:hypothetical protein